MAEPIRAYFRFESKNLYSEADFQKIFKKVARLRATFGVFGGISETGFIRFVSAKPHARL